MQERRKDILGAGILLGLIGVFFLPLATGWGRFFFDDLAFTFYPQQEYLASLLRQGLFPLWDPAVCAGATPFFSRLFSAAYYPVNWIFLLLGRGSFPGLVLLPLYLHYLAAALFSYLLARQGWELNRPGSGVFALAYTLSPSMIYMATFPPEIFVQSWLPLLILLSLRFSRRGGRGWLLLGSVVFTLAASAGDVPFVFHLLFLWGLSVLGWALWAFGTGRRRQAARVLLGTSVMILIGGLLAGVYLSNIAAGLRMLSADDPGVVEDLCSIRQSLHPLYLLTLLIPDFFGGVDLHHSWGAAWESHCTLNDGNLLGGLAAIILVLLSLSRVGKERAARPGLPSPRALFLFFATVVLLGTVMVLGPYTPLYGILKALNPYFGMPYPLRYRIIQNFGMAGLLGVSASVLWARPAGPRLRRVVLYLGVAAAGALLALVWAYRVGDDEILAGYSHLAWLKDYGWFFSVIGGYVLAAGGLLLIFTRFFPRYFGRFLTILVAAELILFAAQACYRNRVLNRRYQDMSAERYRGPGDHPVYLMVREFHRICPEDPSRSRRGYYRSSLDNLGWVFGSNSALGVDVKPMIADFAAVISEAAPGYPYELRPADWTARFWKNMSVGSFVSDRPVPDPEAELRSRFGTFYFYRYPGALPRAYFQDRWSVSDRAGERQALLEYDLRHVGYLPSEAWILRPQGESYPGQEENGRAEGSASFLLFQEENPIGRADFSSPNRMELEILNRSPGMLVLTDVWHPDWRATVNGREETIHRVNYLQRGVWLQSGSNLVVMEFLPSSLGPGLAATAAGLLGLVLLAVSTFKTRSAGGTPKS